VVPKHGSFENFWNQTFDVCCHCEILDANRSSDQTWMVVASWVRRVGVAVWKRPFRLALTEFKHINKYVFVRMWKKFTLASGSSTLPLRTRPKCCYVEKQIILCPFVVFGYASSADSDVSRYVTSDKLLESAYDRNERRHTGNVVEHGGRRFFPKVVYSRQEVGPRSSNFRTL
jgi:hypothetical protein